MMNTAKFVTTVKVKDPDQFGSIELSVFKHGESNAMFAIDASYLDQCFDDDKDPVIPDPYNKKQNVRLTGL